ncbi:MAG: DUF5658 family protein [Planctomycetota bacterium]
MRVRGAAVTIFTTLALLFVATPLRAQSGPAANTKFTVTQGFLFVDGKHIPTPFEIQVRGGELAINDTPYASDYFLLPKEATEPGMQGDERPRPRFRGNGLGAFNRGGGPPGGGPPGGRAKRGSRSRRQAEELQGLLRDLHLGFVAVLYEGEEPLLLDPTGEGQDLLETLTDHDLSDFTAPASLDADEQKLWLQLVAEFESTEKFDSQAMAVLTDNWRAQEINEQEAASNILFNRISFPMTVAAMILVVLAFGHLLANSPSQMVTTDDPDQSKQVHSTVVKSLCFIGLLSVIDLVWTIGATQAGAMREMNPLGQSLIEDPVQLILFKLGVTGLAIGLLYYLHRSPMAQRASWWCCLILTLLTARWLTFQSMFV